MIRQIDRNDGKIDRQIERKIDRIGQDKVDRQIDRQTDRQIERKKDRQIDMQIGQDRIGKERKGQDRQIDRSIDRQIDIQIGQDRTGQDRTGQVGRIGQDRIGEDRTGQDGQIDRQIIRQIDRIGQIFIHRFSWIFHIYFLCQVTGGSPCRNPRAAEQDEAAYKLCLGEATKPWLGWQGVVVSNL